MVDIDRVLALVALGDRSPVAPRLQDHICLDYFALVLMSGPANLNSKK